MSYDFVQQAENFVAAVAQGTTPPGHSIFKYIRSTGTRASDPLVVLNNFATSVASALALCTSETNQILVVLPGHSEAVGTAMFTAAPTGVKIIGAGNVDEDGAPTLLWSGGTSNLAIAAKNTTLGNLRLIANANDVTEAITVTGAGFKLIGCHVDMGVTSSLDAASFLNFSTGAADGLVCGNTMRATVASNALATFVKGNTVVDNLRIVGNRVIGLSSSTTVGAIHISAALTNLFICANHVDNQVASSVGAITFTDVAATGFCSENLCGTLANAATVAAQGITVAGTTNILVHFNQNFSSDGLKGTSGALAPTITT